MEDVFAGLKGYHCQDVVEAEAEFWCQKPIHVGQKTDETKRGSVQETDSSLGEPMNRGGKLRLRAPVAQIRAGTGLNLELDHAIKPPK